MKACKYCGEPMQDKACNCPHCGEYSSGLLKGAYIIVYLTILLAIAVLIFIIRGCHEESEARLQGMSPGFAADHTNR
jgi:hypothetical protein